MKTLYLFIFVFVYAGYLQTQSLLVETESFANKGGWSLDQQFMDQMGSPYLLAHGLGFPVEDATTTVIFPKKGTYQLWVRTRNWASLWTDKTPGQFQVWVNGKQVGANLGVQPDEWSWVKAGAIDIKNKKVSLALHDLTGFDGRCDALFFTGETISCLLLLPKKWLHGEKKCWDYQRSLNQPVRSILCLKNEQNYNPGRTRLGK